MSAQQVKFILSLNLRLRSGFRCETVLIRNAAFAYLKPSLHVY